MTSKTWHIFATPGGKEIYNPVHDVDLECFIGNEYSNIGGAEYIALCGGLRWSDRCMRCIVVGVFKGKLELRSPPKRSRARKRRAQRDTTPEAHPFAHQLDRGINLFIHSSRHTVALCDTLPGLLCADQGNNP